MKNNRKNVIIGIFVTTTILLGCTLAYFVVTLQNTKQENTTQAEKITEYETKVSNLNSEISKYKAQNLTLQNQVKSQENTIKQETTKTVTNQSAVKNISCIYFDPYKRLNGYEANYSAIKYEESSFGIRLELDINGKVYVRNIISEVELKKKSSKIDSKLLKSGETSKSKIEITGFSSKVVDIINFDVPESGGNAYPIMIFLMEDGTVEYLNTKDAFENGNFKSAGKIKGVENIVNIFEGSYGYEQGDLTVDIVFAVKEDGSFYDLTRFIGQETYIINK